jgi:copper chaperone CopZ
MNFTYSIYGLHCDGCVKNISESLPKQLPDVRELSVSLKDGALSFSSEKAFDLSTLNAAVSTLNPRFRVTRYSFLHTVNERYKKYLPLVCMLFLTVAGGIAYALLNGLSLATFIMGYMGSFFVVFGLVKFYNLKGFVDSFAQYDLITPHVRLYGYAYPFIELVLGTLYLLGFGHYAPLNYVCIAISVVTTIGVIRILRKGRRVTCACLGSSFSVPISGLTVFENAVMVVMAILLIAGLHG